MPPENPAHRPLQLALVVEAALLDLGLAGVAVETETRLGTDTAVELALGALGGPEVLRGRVVWCFFHGTSPAATGEQVPVYRAGIEFSDVLTPLASQVVRMLESGPAHPGDSRIFGRFRLANPSRVEVRWGGEGRLTGIAGGSARVEVAWALEPAPGTGAEIRLGDGGEPIRATVLDVARGERPGLWQLELAVDGADGKAIGRLRAAAP